MNNLGIFGRLAVAGAGGGLVLFQTGVAGRQHALDLCKLAGALRAAHYLNRLKKKKQRTIWRRGLSGRRG